MIIFKGRHTATVFGFAATNKGGSPCDVIGALQRDEKGWVVTWRWRHHVDDKITGSADKKNWYQNRHETEAKARLTVLCIVAESAHGEMRNFWCVNPNTEDEKEIDRHLYPALKAAGFAFEKGPTP